jgi:TRAP-type C4-dicarboxylate transport system permease small subunit
MPSILYYFIIIAIALLAVSFLRSIWDRYRHRNERNTNDPEQFLERNPWEFPEKED